MLSSLNPSVKKVLSNNGFIFGVVFTFILAALVIMFYFQFSKVDSSQASKSGCSYLIIGNGICDDSENRRDCFYDGGDCCLTSKLSKVGCDMCRCHNLPGEALLTPANETLTSTFMTKDTSCENLWWSSDGLCDDETNTNECDFDGGDCCGPNKNVDYCSQCMCHEKSTSTVSTSVSFLKSTELPCQTDRIGNGFCDDDTNLDDCNFDGGDCCGSIRNVTSCEQCICHAEVASSSSPTSATMTNECLIPAWAGDGFCDDETNVPECNYDGGDCCDMSRHIGFLGRVVEWCTLCICFVLNPTTPTTPCLKPQFVGDGFCHDVTDTPECDYDGGDCCLVDKIDDFCFNCTCYVEVAPPHPSIINCPESGLVGDGFCNDETNIEVCNHDGGDCCKAIKNVNECTLCICHAEAASTSFSLSSTASNGCPNPEWVGDDLCDDETNTAACNYDGGDCCPSDDHAPLCSLCICYVLKAPLAASTICPYPGNSGNGYCNDNSNIPECGFDGGDCCFGIKDYCFKCLCFIMLETSSAKTNGCLLANQVGDGFCNDDSNTDDCNFDGGDCCLAIKKVDFCTDCICYNEEINLVCHLPGWVGDGFCDDDANVEICNFDGGDCCSSNKNTDYCTECICFASCYQPDWIGDATCDDDLNTKACNYDGGDCCGLVPFEQYCIYCYCYAQPAPPVCSFPIWVGDGICNDVTNTAQCSHDGGDCCASNANFDLCLECKCIN